MDQPRKIVFSPQAALGYGQLGGDVSEIEIDWDVVNPFICPDCQLCRPSIRELPGYLTCADCGRVLAWEADERDAAMTEENDRVWGEGNWTRCPTCPPDPEGNHVYHHRDAHAPSYAPRSK
jgi:hypothetical protein